MYSMIFTARNGQAITFDCWERNREYGTVWVRMCKRCREKYANILGNRVDDEGSGVCSVQGCSYYADSYVDFKETEVSEEEF